MKHDSHFMDGETEAPRGNFFRVIHLVSFRLRSLYLEK